jgi:adenylate cyclase
MIEFNATHGESRMDDLQICIYTNQQHQYSAVLRGKLELGRQEPNETPPIAKGIRKTHDRLVIAGEKENHISREQAIIEPHSAGTIFVENISKTRPIRIENDADLPAGKKRELSVPVRLIFGNVVARIERVIDVAPPLQSLPNVTVPPSSSWSMHRFPGLSSLDAGEDSAESRQRNMLSWLKTSMGVFQSAATSSDFFQKAAQAVVDIAGLDTGRILLLENSEWKSNATATGSVHLADEWLPSHRVLKRVLEEKRTFWELPDSAVNQSNSLRHVSLVVAAPVCAVGGEVIGAVYGDRRIGGLGNMSSISDIEAMLVDLIATAVAGGIARLEQEKAALEERVRFEQFFTRELSESLAKQPDLLKGRTEEVTLLFCDIRGFSRISERLGPERTVQWVGDVMGELSDCVLAHKGVLVDYIGDELVAMWGAPTVQPEHAELACRAAIDMLAKLPILNARWREPLAEPMNFGIGINSGKAQVGNTGSRYKFKYGPLGNTVNLASRVQGVTKQLGVPLLITAATRERLDGELCTRRLCQARVVNIEEPVELYELAAHRPDWDEIRRGYEAGLGALEQKDFPRAASLAGQLLERWPEDFPSRQLLSRAAQALLRPAAEFDPVVEFTSK